MAVLEVVPCCLNHLDSSTHKCVDYVRGYSFYTPSAFNVQGVRSSNVPLSGNYVDGISIAYDTPPTHIWTYAAGFLETGSGAHNCPCI